MPRNVRNFWIEAEIDGRKSAFASGPVSKEGGFTLDISIRDSGSVSRALTVWGRVNHAGEIVLSVENKMEGTAEGLNTPILPGELIEIRTKR